MTLERLDPGPRMSQAVCIGDIAFLAGQVPDDLGADIAEQTRQVLAKIDAVVEGLGRTMADIASVQVWLSDMADFQAMIAGLGRMGGGRRAARPRDRRRGAGPARDEGRDDRHRGARAEQLSTSAAHPFWCDRTPEQLE